MEINRRRFIKTVSGAAASYCIGASLSCSEKKTLLSKEAPNILLLVADDLGWKDLGCYGTTDVRTPNIDRLAAEGVRFTHSFVTASSCSPSRAGIITGQYPHTNGVTGLTHVHKRLMLSPFRKTLPDALAEAGYLTGFEGKWHVAPYFPVGWYGYEKRLSGVMPKDFLIKSSDKAVKFIHENKNAPFYLELNYMDTHRDDAGEFHFVKDFPVDPDKITVPEYYSLPDSPGIRHDIAKYYSNLMWMDEMIGRTLDALDEAGLTERTLICFVSDNGPPYPGNKMTLYDRGIAVPLIFRWPGKIAAGAVSDALVSTIDIMPTLLKAAGADVPGSVQGKSLLPLFRNETEGEFRDAIFAEMTYHVKYLPMRAARTRRWKYIRNYSNDPVGLDQCSEMQWAQELCQLPNQPWLRPRVPEELYDLLNDPHEQLNLAADSSHEQELRMMQALLDEHMRKTDDPFLGRKFERNFS